MFVFSTYCDYKQNYESVDFSKKTLKKNLFIWNKTHPSKVSSSKKNMWLINDFLEKIVVSENLKTDPVVKDMLLWVVQVLSKKDLLLVMCKFVFLL